jgi:3-carboxy-cis,cis-muconate cycloisomerase
LLVTSCGIYAGVLAKIARDIALLMQYEVGEAAEPGGRSSTMPHKRNPAGCAVALAAAAHLPTLVAGFLGGMAQEHERGVGGWQAEAATVAGAVQSTGAALCSMADVVGALGVDPERMRANIVATGGVVFAERAMILLAPRVGRESAQRIIAGALEAARRGNRGFAEALAGDTEAASALQPGELSTLASPEAYLGVAEQLRVRLLGGGRA